MERRRKLKGRCRKGSGEVETLERERPRAARAFQTAGGESKNLYIYIYRHGPGILRELKGYSSDQTQYSRGKKKKK